MERTLAIIKPDGVAKLLMGEVISRIDKAGLKFVAIKRIILTKEVAKGFYAVRKERPFFDSLRVS